MVNEQYERAKQILSEHKEQHNELAQLLIDKEVIFAEDVERIFGKRPWLLVRRKSWQPITNKKTPFILQMEKM